MRQLANWGRVFTCQMTKALKEDRF